MTNLYFPICGLFCMILIVTLFFTKKRFETKETKIYGYMILSSLFDLILITSILAIGYYDYNDFICLLAKIINKVDFIHYIFWITLLLLYVFYITYNNLAKYNSLKKVLFIVDAFAIFIEFLLPIEIINDNGVMGVMGLSSEFVFLVAIIYLIAIIVILLLNIKKIFSKKYIPIIFLIFFLIIAAIVRIMSPTLIIIPTIIAFVDLIMYHTIENPDVKMINALNEAKMSAEKANRAKSEFLSSMSHEIRTPLNAIVGFSDCIMEEDTLEAAKGDAKDIKLASENLLEIVNGILDISKIEADKMEIVETDYNPVETLDNVAKLVKPRIGEKPIELVVKFAPDIPYELHGDGGKLRQIVTNILTNAVKYTEQGSISFFVNCVNEGEFTKLIISVEDTGRGIKPDQIDKLFTKFQRLEEDKNTTLEGTGLGLAITKRFVEMMGGKIVVQSKYGEGSKFTVYLRQRIVEMNKPETALAEELVNTMQIKLFDFSESKVLVVDDNKVNIKVALKLLSNYGVKADACESGFDAIQKVKMGSVYDLILLDDMMPKMSGVETLKKIRESVIYDVPVVALTANALSGMREKYLAEGFDDYLAKPIEKNELYRILLTYLSKKLKKKEEKAEEKIDVKLEETAKLPKLKEESRSKKSILIVDDNKINIKIASKLLSHHDYLEIDSALSGKEAIDKVKNKNYDLVFMDIMMPEMDGVETLHNLRDLGFENPIVTLTADAVEGSREKYIAEGFNEYLSKPVNTEQMDAIVNLFIQKD